MVCLALGFKVACFYCVPSTA